METPKEYDYLFKVLIVGHMRSGLTSIQLRMGKDEFNPANISSIGIDFVIKTVDVDGKRVKIQLWNSSGGRERFRTITSSYYRGSNGIMLIYDITDEDSFKNLIEHHIPAIEMHAPPNGVKMILGNKCDLTESRAVADKHGYTFMEVSAKTGYNTEKALLELATEFKIKVDSKLIEAPPILRQQQSTSKKQASGRCF